MASSTPVRAMDLDLWNIKKMVETAKSESSNSGSVYLILAPPGQLSSVTRMLGKEIEPKLEKRLADHLDNARPVNLAVRGSDHTLQFWHMSRQVLELQNVKIPDRLTILSGAFNRNDNKIHFEHFVPNQEVGVYVYGVDDLPKASEKSDLEAIIVWQNLDAVSDIAVRASAVLPFNTLCKSGEVQAAEYEEMSNHARVSVKQNLSTMCGLKGNLEEVVGVPTSVPVCIAHELLLTGHKYLDVRTTEEFNAGHAPGAINIPYVYKVGSGMTKNINFVEEVSSQFRKEDEVIVGCQLGKSSMMAVTDLLAAGFTGLTDISGGYAAWTQNGLPTEQ